MERRMIVVVRRNPEKLPEWWFSATGPYKEGPIRLIEPLTEEHMNVLGEQLINCNNRLAPVGITFEGNNINGHPLDNREILFPNQEVISPRPCKSELIPSLETIVSQLSTHFEEHPEDKITPEEIQDLAGQIREEFEQIEHKPYRGHFTATRPDPVLHIMVWSNEYTMMERISYPGDYSTLHMSWPKYEHINFAMVTVQAGKYINLNYVTNKGR